MNAVFVSRIPWGNDVAQFVLVLARAVLSLFILF